MPFVPTEHEVNLELSNCAQNDLAMDDDDEEEEHLLRQRRRPASEEDVAVGKEVSQISISSHLSSQSLLVNPSEVKQGKVLCSTLKSTVCVALWQGQQVAVKQLKTLDEEDLVAELLHEIHVLSALQHPCLVKLVGANLDKEGPFMLTEYMEHRDVETYMQQQRQNAEDPYYKPSFEVAMGWALNTGQALEYLHGLPCPIIHRDLKPLNLFLTKHLHVKVGKWQPDRQPGRQTNKQTNTQKPSGKQRGR